MPSRDEADWGCPLELEAPTPFRLDLTVWALRHRPHNAFDRWDEVDSLSETGILKRAEPS